MGGASAKVLRRMRANARAFRSACLNGAIWRMRATHTLDLTSAATPAGDGTSLAVATANKFTGATPGQNVTFTLVSHGGQAGTRAQTNTLTVRLVS